MCWPPKHRGMVGYCSIVRLSGNTRRSAMRVLVIGGSGSIGSAVVEAFRELGDEVISASRNSNPSVDFTDPDSLRALFDEIGTVDAVITAGGASPTAHITEATPEHFATGFASKLGGQINAVLAGLPHISEN